MPTKTTSYTLTFGHSPEGRPEVYDFLWEHLAPFLSTMGEKRVRVTMGLDNPITHWYRACGCSLEEMDSLLRKFSSDKRFSHRVHLNAQKPFLETRIPVEKLDNLLNAHNILFEYLFPHIQIEGKKVRIDFDPAEENAIWLSTDATLGKKGMSFLARSMSNPLHLSERLPISKSLIDATPRKTKKSSSRKKPSHLPSSKTSSHSRSQTKKTRSHHR
ncbi:MAG: hypothetical protein Q8P05_00565 [Candidatus Diapherotrites archaeon]|nr:hypothetical protein [Candidatus Diapherotrites archaeon]MDZ4256650.1 hypothetical protein [archaeon]